jgi:hypothetical protein
LTGSADAQRLAGAVAAVDADQPLSIGRRAVRAGRSGRGRRAFEIQIDVRNGVRELRCIRIASIAQHRDRHLRLRIMREVRTIACGGAAVADFADAAVRRNPQTQRVIVRPAIREMSRLLLLFDEGRVADRRMRQVARPPQQITHSRQQSTVAVHVLEWHVHGKAAAILLVGNRTILDDARVVVTPRRPRHPHRREEPLAGKVSE